MKRIFLLVILFTLISNLLIGVCSCKEQKTLKIGVLLPLTGPEAVDSEEILDWATDKANIGGGIDRRKIELVYRDTYEMDIVKLAQEFIDDRSIQIVIGPGSSAEVYDIAPMFIENKKLLISPLSTAGDVFRAFGSNKFFWRTCQSDIAQIRTILHLLASRDVNRISLIYEDSIYGETFYQWTGFFAMEMGIELLNIVSFENGQSDFSVVVNEALMRSPEYVVCVAFSADAVKIKKELDKRESAVRLFLTDAAETPYLIEELGDAAEGLELITPAADPDSGFEKAYEAEFGYLPYDFAATTYDAFLLSVCTLARYEYKAGKESIDESFQNIVSAYGAKLEWDAVNEAVAVIQEGGLPDIEGASGPLEFDADFGVDPIETFYSLCRIETRDGFRDFWTLETISSSRSLGAGVLGRGASARRTLPSISHADLGEMGEISYVPEARENMWAVIVASSMGWENYRHQADALAVYDLIKNNGVSDDKIILFVIDDVSNNEGNLINGDVHHVVGGKNLRENAVIDYTGTDVTVDNLEDVLLGNKTAITPDVLETNEHSNILLYIVDHGAPGFIAFDNDPGYSGLNVENLSKVIERMYENQRYRQMFIMVDACHSESMAFDVDAPGVVYFTSAAKNESSFGTNYDREIRAWLADDFTYQVINILQEKQDLSILDLYVSVYERVAGSHVRLKNYSNFGDLYNTLISEFVTP